MIKNDKNDENARNARNDRRVENGELNTGRFLRRLFLTAALLLAAAALLVLLFDPYYHYHKPLPGLKAVLQEKEYQVVGTLRHFDYDAVLAGSSMVENNDNAWFDEAFGCRTVKAVRSYGGVADLAWFLREAFEHREVRKVFFNIDPASLTLSPETTFKATGCPMYLYDRDPVNDVSYLLNISVLAEKIPYMLARSLGGYNEGLSYNWAEGKDFSRQGALSHYDRLEERLPVKPADCYAENLAGNIALLEELVGAHPETEFFFFLPPYSAAWWDDSVRNGEYEAYLYCMKKTAESLLPFENVRFFDFQNERGITTDLDNYMDTIHFSPEINRLLVDYMKEGRCELSQETLDGVFEETKAFALSIPEELFSESN